MRVSVDVSQIYPQRATELERSFVPTASYINMIVAQAKYRFLHYHPDCEHCCAAKVGFVEVPLYKSTNHFLEQQNK